MSDETNAKTTAKDRIEAAQARRKAQREAEEAQALEQLAIDVEAITDIEASEGYKRVIAIDLGNVYKPGVGMPVRVAVRVPLMSESHAQAFIETINKYKEGSKQRLEAQDALAVECWRYPAKGSPAYRAMLEYAPLILSNAALQIVKASQGEAQEQGKD